jgi:type II secretory pathway component PulJ
MKSNSGYTYIELLTSLVISAFVVLSITAVSSISQRSYDKTMKEASVFAEVTYGFKLMQNRVRSAESSIEQSASGQWMSEQLVLNNKEAFGLYRAAGSSTTDFVYLEDKSQTNNREVILSVPNSNSISFNVTLSGKAVTIRVNGNKGKIPFDLSTVVVRRG